MVILLFTVGGGGAFVSLVVILTGVVSCIYFYGSLCAYMSTDAGLCSIYVFNEVDVCTGVS